MMLKGRRYTAVPSGRLFRAVLSVLLIATLAGSATVPSAGAAPAPKRVLLEGRGWGHGRGMGQWGARGMARKGASWRRIVTHYYSGIDIERAGRDRRRVRVLLDTRPSVVIAGTDRFALRFDGRRIRARTGRYYRVRPRALHVSRRLAGPWRVVARPIGTVYASGARVALVSPRGRQRAYAGTFRLSRSRDAIRIVNVVRMRHYLRGVVPREMPSSWPLEALKAQTVAARTYSVRVMRGARRMGATYDICDDTRCQVYGGLAVRARRGARWQRLTRVRTDRAIAGTRGRILTYRGQPILAEYSSSTGGYTVNGHVPYLRAVRDRADRGAPLHRWLHEVAGRSIERAWPSIGRFRRLAVVARDGRGAYGGRARTVAVTGSARTVRIPAEQFRSRLGLRTTFFRIAPSGGRHRFGRNLGRGMQHVDVGYLQKRLRNGGFYPRSWPITSYFGGVTEDAVRRYQRARALPATGFVGPKTRAKLNGARRNASQRYRFRFDMGYGTQHPAVMRLQKRLRTEGFYPRGGPFTNFYGSITTGAVKRYQRARGIRQTGFLGPITRRSLNR